MKIEGNVITAEEGKVLRRISDQIVFGDVVYLGYTYYINNEKLDEPLLELPEHYEEIDKPEEEKPEEENPIEEIKEDKE